MPDLRTYRCEAIILKRIPFGESGLMVTLLTKEMGKVTAVARGARKAKSKLVGHLEPLTQTQLLLAKGPNLDYISQAQVISNFPGLRGDLDAVAKGLYVAELVDGFGTEAIANPGLYSLAIETLHSIGQHPDSDWPLRFFELRLLRVSGLMPELYQCVECAETLTPSQHRFSPSLGGALCLYCRPERAHVLPLSLRALKVLRHIDRAPLPDVIPLQIDAALSDELKSLIGGTVSYWLEREIRSNAFLQQLRKESEIGVYT